MTISKLHLLRKSLRIKLPFTWTQPYKCVKLCFFLFRSIWYIFIVLYIIFLVVIGLGVSISGNAAKNGFNFFWNSTSLLKKIPMWILLIRVNKVHLVRGYCYILPHVSLMITCLKLIILLSEHDLLIVCVYPWCFTHRIILAVRFRLRIIFLRWMKRLWWLKTAFALDILKEGHFTFNGTLLRSTVFGNTLSALIVSRHWYQLWWVLSWIKICIVDSANIAILLFRFCVIIIKCGLFIIFFTLLIFLVYCSCFGLFATFFQRFCHFSSHVFWVHLSRLAQHLPLKLKAFKMSPYVFNKQLNYNFNRFFKRPAKILISSMC